MSSSKVAYSLLGKIDVPLLDGDSVLLCVRLVAEMISGGDVVEESPLLFSDWPCASSGLLEFRTASKMASLTSATGGFSSLWSPSCRSRFSSPSTLLRSASSTSVFGPRFLGTASGRHLQLSLHIHGICFSYHRHRGTRRSDMLHKTASSDCT